MNNIIQPEHRILYNKTFKDRTKELRKNMTKPEKKLRFDFLKHLDKKDIDSNFDLSKINFNYGSLRIYKQRPIENFIVDFYIPKLKLVIEVDGDSHFDEQGLAYDEERTQTLQGLGLKVIRFTNEEVIENFSGVCEILKKEIGIN